MKILSHFLSLQYLTAILDSILILEYMYMDASDSITVVCRFFIKKILIFKVKGSTSQFKLLFL